MGKLIRAMSADGMVRCIAIDSTDMVYEAEQIHKTSAAVTAALGRLLTASSMMGVLLKGENDTMTIRMSGDGPAGALIAVSNAKGNVKGYVMNPVVELPLNQYGKLDVAGVVGRQGTMQIIKDLGMREPYIGQVPIVSGEIAEDITNYFAVSEQTPTVCGLGVLVAPDLTAKAAGGYLVQLMPGAEEETIAKLEKNIEGIPAVSKMIADKKSPKEIINMVLDSLQPQILDEMTVCYHCDCSVERVERALISLGREELETMAREQDVTEVNCHFCNKIYRFSSEEIKNLGNPSEKC